MPRTYVSFSDFADADNEFAFEGATDAIVLHIGNLNDADTVLVSSLLSGNFVGFFQDDTEVSFVEITESYETHGAIHVEAIPDDLTIGEDYNIRFTQARPGTALTGAQIVALLTALMGDARLSYNALKDLPHLADTLTGEQVVTLLTALSGDDRLSYNALKDHPQILTEAQVNALIAGFGPQFTQALLDKLNGIEDMATRDQTAAEIVALLSALGGGDRLSYHVLRDLPDLSGVSSEGMPSVELLDGMVTIANAGQWVDLGVSIPDTSIADWGLVQIRLGRIAGGWIPVNFGQIRILTAASPMEDHAEATRLPIYGAHGILNTVYFGRTSGGNLLFAIDQFGELDEDLDVMRLLIHRVNKAIQQPFETGLIGTFNLIGATETLQATGITLDADDTEILLDVGPWTGVNDVAETKLIRVERIPTATAGDAITTSNALYVFDVYSEADGVWMYLAITSDRELLVAPDSDWSEFITNPDVNITVRRPLGQGPQGEPGPAGGLTEAEVNALIAAYGLPFTQALLDKLNGIESNATADQTGAEIVALLEALTSGNRLSYTALDDTPTIPPPTTLRTAAQTARLLETLMDAARLSYTALKDTPTIPPATTLRTAAETARLLETLMDANRLSYNALKDTPTAGDTEIEAIRMKLAGIEDMATRLYVEFSHDGVHWFGPNRRIERTRFLAASINAPILAEDNIWYNPNDILSFYIWTGADEAFIDQLDSSWKIRIQESDTVYVEADITTVNTILNQPNARAIHVENVVTMGTLFNNQDATVVFTYDSTGDIEQVRVSKDQNVWTTFDVSDAFDIHDDVPDASTSLQLDDRFIFSAENEVDDPMRYATLTTLRTAIRRSASETYALIQSMLNYNDLQNQLTGAQLKALLEALTGTGRLEYSAIQNGPQLRIMEESEVSYTSDHQVVFTTSDGAEESIGEIYVFQYRRNRTASDTEVTISVNGSTAQRVRMLSSSRALRFMQVNDITRYAVYMVLRVSGVWQLIGQTLPEIVPPFDIHDHVTSASTSLQLNDRFIFSAENESGDPMYYATIMTLRDYIRRSASETYALINNLIQYSDIQGTPTIPTLRTASETADLLETLTGDNRLAYSALRDTPTIPALRSADDTARLLETLAGMDRLRATAIQGLEPGVYIEFSNDGIGWYNYDRQLELTRVYEEENAQGDAVGADEVYIVPGQNRISLGYQSQQALIDSLDTNHHIRLEQGASFFEGTVTGNSDYGSSTDVIQILMANIMSNGTFTDGDPVTITVTLNAAVAFDRVRFSDDNVNWQEFNIPDESGGGGYITEGLGSFTVAEDVDDDNTFIDTGIDILDTHHWYEVKQTDGQWESVFIDDIRALPPAAVGDETSSSNSIYIPTSFFRAVRYGVRLGRSVDNDLLAGPSFGSASWPDYTCTIRVVRETAGGLPTGGTMGQVLTKLTSSDYDYEWRTIMGGVTGAQIVALLTALMGAEKLPYSALRDAPTIPPGFDIHDDVAASATPNDNDRFIFSDEEGAGDPMRYIPFTGLRNLMRPTGEEVVTLLEALAAGNRLSYTALDDLPTIPPATTLRTAEQTARLLETLMGADRFSYNSLKDTPTIPPATTLRTAEETARLLETLMGGDRFSYNSLKDLPTITQGVEFLLQYSTDGMNWFNRDNQYVYDREYELPDAFVSNVDPNEVGASSGGGSIYLGHSAAELAFLQTFAVGDRIRIEETADIFTEGTIDSIDEFTGLIEYTLESGSIMSMGSFTDGADVTVAFTPATAPARNRTRFSINNSPFIVIPANITLRTGAETADLLEALTGNDRLAYSALRDTPTIPTLRTPEQIARLLETLTADDRLSNRFLRDRSVQRLESPPAAPAARDDVLYFDTDSEDQVEQVEYKDNRKRPFFTLTTADLGDGHIGYAGAGYDGLGDGFAVDAGGSVGYSGLGAISEEYHSTAHTAFERVGTYTFSQGRGLGADDDYLYILEDTGTTARVRGFNPSDGSIVFTSDDFTATVVRGLVVFDNHAYASTQLDDIYRINLTTGAVDLWNNSSESNMLGLAEIDGTIYYVSTPGTSFLTLGSLDDSGDETDIGTITGLSYHLAGGVVGLTAIDGVLYLSVPVSPDGHFQLYTINPTTAAATHVGTISPANQRFRGLAQLGDYVYGFNSINNGVYRAFARTGSRWTAIFPSTTTEVDTDDTLLLLYTSEGAAPIDLTRDTDITDAIVFASEFDRDATQQLSAGQNLNFALYNGDGEQLYEGADESVYRKVPTTARELVELIESLRQDNRLSYNALKDKPALTGTGSLTGNQVVELLEDLTGSDRLSYNDLKETPTGSAIVTLLMALTGDDRLDASAIKNLGAGITLRTAVETARLLETLTGGDRFSYNSLKDTPTIPPSVTLRTAAETARLLETLSGASRFSYTSLKDTPAAFNLVNDVPTAISPIEDSDILLMGDVGAQANRRITLADLEQRIRPTAADEGVAIDESPTSYNFVGAGVNVTTNNTGGVNVNIDAHRYDTTQIHNADVTVGTSEEWVELDGTSIPATTQADWAVLQIDDNDTIEIDLTILRAKDVGTGGQASTESQRMTVHSRNLLNDIYIGRNSDGEFLFSSKDFNGDGAPFSPTPLIIYRVNK